MRGGKPNMASSDWKQQPSTEELRQAYDTIPYLNPPKPFTYISRLAALGQRRGLVTASVERCRVLEIGCADGGNLLPMAYRYPDSQFLGIDLSPVQIEMGQRAIDELALSNFQLAAADLMALKPADLDTYDYIIVHGVYSWVPDVVRDGILSICRNHLSPHGVAYISYNTYPGWKAKEAVREMLRFHTREITDLSQKVEAAFDLLKVLPSAESASKDPAALVIERLRTDLSQMEDPATYLIHEYLVDINQPYYFTEFLGHLRSSGLQYVDDAYPGSASLTRLPSVAQEWIRGHYPDAMLQQQYIDLLGNVSFRRSLVCRDDQVLYQEVSLQRYEQLHITATCRWDESSNEQKGFCTDSGRRFSVDNAPLEKQLASLAAARPESRSVRDLQRELSSWMSDEEVALSLDGLLLGGAIEIWSTPSPCVREIQEFPFANGMVRQQALSGRAANASHRLMQLDNPLERVLLASLDGGRSLSDLVELLRKRLTPNHPLSPEQWMQVARGTLERLATAGLLERP